jgi:hypothetical protein
MRGPMGESACLIDNWTLELAGVLLEQGTGGLITHQRLPLSADIKWGGTDGDRASDFDPEPSSQADECFAALANLLSALTLFDKVYFVRNGFERTWLRLPSFAASVGPLVEGLSVDNARARPLGLRDAHPSGLEAYVSQAAEYQCDLLVSPRRSHEFGRLLTRARPSYGDLANDLLDNLDHRISETIVELGSETLTAALLPGLRWPAISWLVLAKAEGRRDILPSVTRVRWQPEVVALRAALGHCAAAARSAVPFVELAARIPDAVRYALRNTGQLDPDRAALTVGFSVGFASFEKDIGSPIPKHLLFMRDLARCRFEWEASEGPWRRIFGDPRSA